MPNTRRIVGILIILHNIKHKYHFLSNLIKNMKFINKYNITKI